MAKKPSLTITRRSLQKTAIYKGPAAGRYAVKTFNSNATIDSIRHGVFEAAVTLTAKFERRQYRRKTSTTRSPERLLASRVRTATISVRGV